MLPATALKPVRPRLQAMLPADDNRRMCGLPFGKADDLGGHGDFLIEPIDDDDLQFVIMRFAQRGGRKEMRSHFRVVFPSASLAVGVEIIAHIFAG